MYQGDWSTLPVDQAWNDFQSQETSQFTPGGAVLQTPNGRMEGGEFGKYSGIKQNPDGTYRVARLRDNKTSDNDYEVSQYKIEVGPDGQQRMVQISDWTPQSFNSGWEKNLKAAAGMGAVMLGGAAMGGAFGGAGAGMAVPSTAASEAGLLGGMEAGGVGAGTAGMAIPSTAASEAGLLAGVGNAAVPMAGTAAGASGASNLLGGISGGQALAGLLGGAAGIAGSGPETSTSQDKMDPRMDPYVYGDEGVLKAAQDLYNKHKDGNPMVQRGAKMTEDYYTSPEFIEEQKKRRAIGMGLLGGPVAGNPFNDGRATLSPSNNGLLTPYMQTGVFAAPTKPRTPTSGTRG